MAFQARHAIGYSGSPVLWVGPDEVAWTCGNAVVFYTLSTRAQRLLKGSGFGVSCFAADRKHGLLAIAEKGLKPSVVIYSCRTLQQLARLSPGELRPDQGADLTQLPGGDKHSTQQDQQSSGIALGVTAIAFSGDGERLAVCGDEPDCSLIVYQWRKAEVLVSARGLAPAAQVSFHPHDPAVFAVTGGGATSIWFVERLWDRTVCRPQHVGPTSLSAVPTAAGQQTSVHAWSPHGLLCGTEDGTLLLLDPATLHPVQYSGGAPGASQQSSGVGGGAGSSSPPLSSSPSVHITPAVVPDAVGPGAGVAALALNRDHLAVTGTDGSVHVFSLGPCAAGSGPPAFSHEVRLGRGGATGVSVSSADIGGPDYETLLVGCLDGTVYRSEVGPHPGAGVASRAGYTLASLVADCHVGRVTGLAQHPGGGGFVTAGTDGSVRVWAAADGSLVAKKAFSSAQVALAVAAAGSGLAAVGSETGVVRVVALPSISTGAPGPQAPTGSSSSAASTGLRILYRSRLHSGPVDGMAFSPANDMLCSAGRDGSVWLLSVDPRSGAVHALGHVPAPERVLTVAWPRVSDADESVLLSLAGGGLMCVSVSPELTSGNWRNPQPDLRLLRPPPQVVGRPSTHVGEDDDDGGGGAAGPPEAVVVQLLKLEVALLALVCTPGERYGDVYGLGADKQLHKLSLPSEAAAWAGLRARPARSAIHVVAHGRVGGAGGGGVALAPAGHLLVSGAADGVVALRNLSLIALADTSASGVGLHDVTAGGVTSIAFEATGRYFASSGADGALVVYELGSHYTQLVAPPPAVLPYAMPSGRPGGDGDDIDDPVELTEVALRQRGAAGQAGSGAEGRRAAVAARLAAMRSRIAELMAANESAPELEKLQRTDMIVDLGLVDSLKREAEVRVEKVQADVKREHLRAELLAERVRRMAWESMAVKGAVISGLRSQTQVANFAVAQPGGHEKVLRQMTLLRRVEMAEHRALGVVPYSLLFRGEGMRDGSTEGDDGPDTLGPEASMASMASVATPGQKAAHAAAAAAAAAGGASGSEQLDALMYSEFDLHCNTRKALQAHLIRQKIREVKAAFNADFERVAGQKRGDCDRIADLNARLDDTLKDLRKLGAGPPAGLLDERYLSAIHDTRDNIQATVLTVRDDEVRADRYVSPEERAKQAAAKRAEEEAAARSAKDNAGERALRQMMGGTLAAKGGAVDGEGNPFSLPRPAWLVAAGMEPDAVNIKLLTDEQARELKEWQAREKALQEERARRVGILESELRTSKAAIEETVSRFDEALNALAARRLKASGEVAALETRIVSLASGLARCARTSEAAERSLLGRLGSAKEGHGRASAELADRRALLAELEGRAAQAAADERSLDRNFKKEFADADVHLNRLLALYRARRPEQLAGGAGAGASASGGVDASGFSARGPPPALHRQLSHQVSMAHGGAAADAGTASPTRAHSQTGAAAVPSPASAPTYTHPIPTLPSALAATTMDPFPELPPHMLAPDPHDAGHRPGSSALGASPPPPRHAAHHHGHHHYGAAAAGGGGLDVAAYRPEGLDPGMWDRFVAYRSERLAAEAALRQANSELSLARRDMPELEAREASLGSEMENLMSSIATLRTERRTFAYDNELQLRLLAGQVEAMPPTPASADMSDARLLARASVEALNAVVLGKGAKKVEILTAIKDFKHGIYTAQWEAAASDMTLDDLRAKIKDLQLLHVTRDMQTVLKDGEDRSAALEAASLEALMKQRERLHAKALEDKRRRLKKLAADVSSRAAQNAEVAVHLVTLGKVLEEQQRLQGGMQSANEQAARRMRSLVTHKKLKEIALAQQAELAELREGLEKLRLRTYPTFVEVAPLGGSGRRPAADTRGALPGSSPSMGSVGRA